jgi:hypothetical protein
MTRTQKLAALIAGSGLGILVVLGFVPPVPQDPAYHAFADKRAWLGIPNAADVLTNVAFTAVGLWGLWRLTFTASGKSFAARTWTLPYAVFLIGLALVGPGSAYYHWSPDNGSLVWDRLPMTVAFMGLLVMIISDRIGERTGKALLLPLVLAGMGSVFYWAFTDDLRVYGLVQFLPIVVALLICWMFPARDGLRRIHLAVLFVCYAAAKLLEAGDMLVWDGLGLIVSGHSLKHVMAAIGCTAVVVAIRKNAVL